MKGIQNKLFDLLFFHVWRLFSYTGEPVSFLFAGCAGLTGLSANISGQLNKHKEEHDNHYRRLLNPN